MARSKDNTPPRSRGPAGSPSPDAEGKDGSPAAHRWLLPLILVLATLAAYLIDPAGGGVGGALDSGFVFDDIHLIAGNPKLQEGGGAFDGFTGDYYTTGQVSATTGEVRALGYYRPLSVLSTWIDHRIWGLNPFGYHLTSLLLHLGGSLFSLPFATPKQAINTKTFDCHETTP